MKILFIQSLELLCNFFIFAFHLTASKMIMFQSLLNVSVLYRLFPK